MWEYQMQQRVGYTYPASRGLVWLGLKGKDVGMGLVLETLGGGS